MSDEDHLNNILAQFQNLSTNSEEDESQLFSLSISNISEFEPTTNMATPNDSNPIRLTAYKYTSTIMMLTSPIPTFSGEPHKLQDFLDTAHTANLECLPEFRPILFAQIVQKISGLARGNLKSHPNVNNWEALRIHLINQYRPRKDYNTLHAELQMVSQKKDEKILAYYERIQRMGHRAKEAGRLENVLSNTTIEEMITHTSLYRFTNGCHEQISLVLECKEPKNINDALATALKVENKAANTQFTRTAHSNKYCKNCKTSTHNTENCRRSSNFTKSCRYCRNVGHTIDECRKKKYNDERNSDSAINTISNPSHSGPLNSKSCRYCKKPGHMLEECRKLKWKKEQESKKTNYKQPLENGKRPGSPAFSKVNIVQTPASSSSSSVSIASIGISSDMIIQLQSPVIQDGPLIFLVDTGAETSLIRKERLKTWKNAPIDSQRIKKLTGFGDDQIHSTKGSIALPVQFNNEIYEMTFHTLDENTFNLKVDGILGRNIMMQGGATLDCTTHQLNFTRFNIQLPLLSLHEIEPQTRKILNVQVSSKSPKEGIIQLPSVESDAPTHVFTSNLVRKNDNNTVPLIVTNPSDKYARVLVPLLNLQTPSHILSASLLSDTENPDRKTKLRENLRLTHLTSEEQKKLLTLLDEYNDIFYLPGDKLVSEIKSYHDIKLKDDVKPIYVKNYRFPEIHKSEVEKQTSELLKQNIIKTSDSAWNAPIWIVPKKIDASGKQKWRIVVDYRKLNEVTIPDRYPIPNMDDIFDSLANAKVFTTLDLAQGFHQIPIKPEDRPKTAFSTHKGHFEFNKMPFGLINAPATFQRIMNNILNGILGNECFVYLDDIIIFSNSFESHLPKLRNVFNRLRENQLFIQPDKSEFIHGQLPYLGFIISQNGIKPNPAKVDSIRNFPEPKNVRSIQQFLGLAGFYRRFIQDYSKIIKPLTSLLRKDTPFVWTSECQKSFENLKEELTSDNLILQYPNFDELFYLYTDASNYAIGAVLQQKDSNSCFKPVSFASRTLNKAEVNYSTIEKELLAIVWATKYFRPYLFGRKFIIRSDHRPLVWLFKIRDPGSRLLRWRLKLEEFNYEVEYVPGAQNTVADCLSRISEIHTLVPLDTILLTDCKTIAIISSPDIIEHNSLVTPTMLKSLTDQPINILEDSARRFMVLCYTRESEHEPFEILKYKSVLSKLRQILVDHNKTNVGIIDDFDGGVTSENSRHATENLLINELHPINPLWLCLKKKPAKLQSFLKEVHTHPLAGHPGIKRTFNLLKSKGYHWSGMKQDISDFNKACHECQLTKISRQPRKHPILITDTSSEPTEKISLDFLGPYTTTDDGNKQIMSLQDDLTKFIVLKAVPNADTTVVVNILMEYFSLFGIPKKIRTDQGRNFCSNLMKELTEELGIGKIECTAYHPESNGALERSHGTLKEHIKFYVNSERTNWDRYISTAVYAYNNAVHSATNFSPYQLMFGRQPNLPYLDPEINVSYDDYLTTTKQKLHQLHHKAYENQRKNKESSQTRFNKRKLASYPYCKGDQVLIESSKLPSVRGIPTFSKPFAGPFSVTDLKYPNVTIDVFGEKKTYHSNNLKPYVLPINLITFLIFSFFFTLVSGTSKFTAINEKSGILFQRLGHAGHHTSNWNLFTTFNLSSYQDRIASLDRISLATKAIESDKHLTNYSPVMKQQMSALFTLYEDITSSVEHTRVRRGLFNAVSLLQKALWGTPSAYDADEWNENIATLQQNTELEKKLLENQFQYVNNTVHGFVDTFQTFEVNMNKISNELEILANVSNNFQVTLNETLIRQTTIILQTTFSDCYFQTYSELYSLLDAIIDAKRNLLHPTVLTPSKLLSQMNTHLLPHDQTFPLPVNVTTIARYFDISTVHSQVLGHHLTFILTIPLCSNIQYDLMKLIPFPFAETYPATIFHFISPKAPYLFTNKAVNRYHPLMDLSTCRHLLIDFYLCDIPNIRRIVTTNDCELQLLRLRPGQCNLTSMPAIEEMWEQLDPNNWAFIHNHRQTITISCINQTDHTILLPNVGILTLDPSCSAFSETTDLHAQSAENTYINVHAPEINLSIPKLELPYGFNFQPLRLQHIDLDQFNQYSLQLENANQKVLTEFLPIEQHHLNWFLLGFQIILLLIIVGAIIFLYQYIKTYTLTLFSRATSFLTPIQQPHFEAQETVKTSVAPISEERKSIPPFPFRNSFHKSNRHIPSPNPSVRSTNPYCA